MTAENTDSPVPVTTDDELRDRFNPRDRDELLAQARAVHEHRLERANLEELEALTPLELMLLERAYDLGRVDVVAHVQALVGPAAVTVDAQAIRERASSAPTRRVRDLKSGGLTGFGPDPRIVRLVVQAREAVAAAEGQPWARDIELRNAYLPPSSRWLEAIDARILEFGSADSAENDHAHITRRELQALRRNVAGAELNVEAELARRESERSA